MEIPEVKSYQTGVSVTYMYEFRSLLQKKG